MQKIPRASPGGGAQGRWAVRRGWEVVSNPCLTEWARLRWEQGRRSTRRAEGHSMQQHHDAMTMQLTPNTEARRRI